MVTPGLYISGKGKQWECQCCYLPHDASQDCRQGCCTRPGAQQQQQCQLQACRTAIHMLKKAMQALRLLITDFNRTFCSSKGVKA
jgi:hypothetical protein